MNENEIHIGLDISKGTAEVCFKNSAARILLEGTFDGTPNGHARLEEEIKNAMSREKPQRVQICMESTGGLERNWYRSIKKFAEGESVEVEVYIINPLLIHGFVREKLHSSSTDVSAARDIAEYLRLGRPLPELKNGEYLLEGAVNLYRTIQNSVERYSKLKNELQSLLPQVHPELGKYVRTSIPNWVLIFLEKYPIVNSLSRVRAATIAKIPGITLAKAEELTQAAKVSVAAFRDDMTGLAIKHLAQDILSLGKTIDTLKAALTSHVGGNDLVQRIVSIPGMAEWTAVGLIVEIGDIRRFSKAEQVIAYAGLDPAYHQSGDGIVRSKISRKGKASIRKLLYMPAQTAAMHNPVIKEFYNRLRGGGKTHRDALTACMGKMIRIVYALWVTGKDFDPKYAEKKASTRETSPTPKTVIPGKSRLADPVWDNDAPISRREAQRRKRLQAEDSHAEADKESKASQPENKDAKLGSESEKGIQADGDDHSKNHPQQAKKCFQSKIATRSTPQIQQTESKARLIKKRPPQGIKDTAALGRVAAMEV
jgi:transposase